MSTGAVKEMFGSIAGRYDFLNHFLSGNFDRVWRRNCVKEVAGRLDVKRPIILDVGCGTADLSLSFSRLGESPSRGKLFGNSSSAMPDK